jgi:signal transduction histidine kinase
MKLFWGGKKKSTGGQAVTTSANTSDVDTQLQAANEDLYKHSVELVAKNKTLSLLGRLYEISILALEPKDLALRFCQTIQTDFEFELVGILRYQTTDGLLEPLAFAQSTHFESTHTDGTAAYQPDKLLACKQSDFFKRVIIEKRMGYSEDFTEICDSGITPEMLEKIRLDKHIRSSLVYPLIIEGNVIGLLVLCLNRVFHDLADFEKQSIESFVNVIAVALDKTLLYEELAKTNKELIQSNERQSNLIHFISHEVKGFLTKDIAAFSELIEGDYGTLPDAAHTLAEGALAQSRDGARAVTELLEASNLKEGTVHYVMTLFDFKEPFLEVAEKLRPLAEKKGLHYTVEIDKNANYMINGDRGQLQDHVLRNMIENAINYTKEGGIVLSLTKNDEHVVLTIKDTGVGISQEDMLHLFTEGGHGRDAIKVNVNSTGYGLFIVKNIIDAHNGTITAQSDGEGKGAMFTMELPTVKA